MHFFCALMWWMPLISQVRLSLLSTKRNQPLSYEWVNTMLLNREVSITFEDYFSSRTISLGHSQGVTSRVSPWLWWLIMIGLLRKLSELGFYYQVYADDGVVLIVSPFLGTVCDLMKSACRHLEYWCDKVVLLINPIKTV